MSPETKLFLALLSVLGVALCLIATGCGIGTGKLNFGLTVLGICVAWAVLRVMAITTPRK